GGCGRGSARRTGGVVREVIRATNFSAEGAPAAHDLAEALRDKGLAVSRLARGVPAGGELEYVDAGAVAWARMERRATRSQAPGAASPREPTEVTPVWSGL